LPLRLPGRHGPLVFGPAEAGTPVRAVAILARPGPLHGRAVARQERLTPVCGICGCIGTAPSPAGADIGPMVEALRNRGPDACGVWSEPDHRVVLGHTRLSIIDLAGSKQPMTNEEGTVVLTYNGEIYNFA